jgi:hypothetical protein
MLQPPPPPSPGAVVRDAPTLLRRVAPPDPRAGVGNDLLAMRGNTVTSPEPRLHPAPLAAVLAAYGWPELDPDDKDESIKRLRALNARRAAEEAAAAAEGDNR